MFRFTKKPSSGSHSQCLAKITRSGSQLRCVLCNVHNTHLNSEPLLVILAKHWLWLPDDGFFVNRNMLEQPL